MRESSTQEVELGNAGAGRLLRYPVRARRGGRAVECGGLENRYPSLGGSRVQIPPPPLAGAKTLRLAGSTRRVRGSPHGARRSWLVLPRRQGRVRIPRVLSAPVPIVPQG